MNLEEGVADLHLHTTASDGTCSIPDRIAQARDRGLAAIAITDHDGIADELTARTEKRDGIEVVTGVEVRADAHDTKIELLGHFVDPDGDELRDVLERAREYRRERNRELVPAVAREAGVDLTYESLREEVEGSLGRPHIATKLVEAGVVDSIGEAFETYLAEEGDAYVPMERVPHEEVLAAIHAAGGVASLAHPGRIRSDEVPSIVSTLVTHGLDGVEVWYPYDEAASARATEAARLAAEHDLLRAGGSDCHGPGSDKFRIGSVRVPEGALAALRDRADSIRPIER